MKIFVRKKHFAIYLQFIKIPTILMTDTERNTIIIFKKIKKLFLFILNKTVLISIFIYL